MTKECWTATELRAECNRIALMVGSECQVYLSVTDTRYAEQTICSVSVHPRGITGKPDGKYFKGATFGEVFAAAEEYAHAATGIYAQSIIRRMALAIIDITDRLGACSDLMLKAEKFSAGEIASYHIEACDAASRMSGNSPFVVTMSVGSIAA